MTLNGNRIQKYMHFNKPLPSVQGMSVWRDRAFILFDTGCCGVYDLISRDPKPIAFFPLGSYNTGTPDRNYLNHANSCMFSHQHWQNNPIPLMYVTIGSGIGKDADGFFYRCAVENIICDEDGRYHAEILQTISYRPDNMNMLPFEQPSWGCPAWLVDSDHDALYMFSARYRTTRGHTPEGQKNACIISKFRLPDFSSGDMIQLGPKDILDQFTHESDVMFTQGGTLHKGLLYYTFGCPEQGYPIHILVFDLKQKRLIQQIDHLDEKFGNEEIECCGVYHDGLLCNTCDGGLYLIENSGA